MRQNTKPRFPPVIQNDDRVFFDPLPAVYVYDHCPYCVRVRMILGMKKINHNLIFLANDDWETPVGLIGKKAVPILIASHYGENKVVMPESLDIVKYVDTHPSFVEAGAPILSPGTEKSETIAKITGDPAWKISVNIRIPLQENLGEFYTKQARETFKLRHGINPEDESKLWEDDFQVRSSIDPKTSQNIAKINKELLPQLEELIVGPFVNGNNPSYDDICFWPSLRSLTLVKAAEMGPNVGMYLQFVQGVVDIPLFNRLAI